MLTNEQATNWLIAQLAGQAEPLSVPEELRAVDDTEVYGVHMGTVLERNRLLVKLPEELPGGAVGEAEFLITVHRVAKRYQ